ncbi:hypothetical protein QE152_g7456 [Popillia japonica]|uniref:Uncharacterized protein n=1 Tax=Popillia japonica TaxID=7064 RepID=A0AAW1MDB9_POPJA
MPKVASNLQQAMEITIPSMNNQTPLSPMLSPLISPNWQYPPNPFSQSNSFMNMMQQTHQYFFNPLHNSLSSSGYQSIGQFSGSNLSLEQTGRDSYSTILSSTSTSSPISSPRNVSPSYQHRAFTDTSSDLSSVVSDLSSSEHGKPEDVSSPPTPCDFDQKRIAGFKAMQNRPTGGGYRYPNSTWSGYGISHTTPGIALPKSDFDMNPMDNDIWKTPTPQQNTDVWQMDANRPKRTWPNWA